MKRSEMLQLLDKHFEQACYQDYLPDSEEVLKLIEKSGMKPPGVAAEVIKGSDYPFGSGCSMRCRCEDCDPKYKMHQWEKE